MNLPTNPFPAQGTCKSLKFQGNSRLWAFSTHQVPSQSIFFFGDFCVNKALSCLTKAQCHCPACGTEPPQLCQPGAFSSFSTLDFHGISAFPQGLSLFCHQNLHSLKKKKKKRWWAPNPSWDQTKEVSNSFNFFNEHFFVLWIFMEWFCGSLGGVGNIQPCLAHPWHFQSGTKTNQKNKINPHTWPHPPIPEKPSRLHHTPCPTSEMVSSQ